MPTKSKSTYESKHSTKDAGFTHAEEASRVEFWVSADSKKTDHHVESKSELIKKISMRQRLFPWMYEQSKECTSESNLKPTGIPFTETRDHKPSRRY